MQMTFLNKVATEIFSASYEFRYKDLQMYSQGAYIISAMTARSYFTAFVMAQKTCSD